MRSREIGWLIRVSTWQVTKKGAPATDAASLRDLAGSPTDSPPVFGSAYKAFGGGDAGKAACEALESLCRVIAAPTYFCSSDLLL